MSDVTFIDSFDRSNFTALRFLLELRTLLENVAYRGCIVAWEALKDERVVERATAPLAPEHVRDAVLHFIRLAHEKNETDSKITYRIRKTEMAFCFAMFRKMVPDVHLALMHLRQQPLTFAILIVGQCLTYEAISSLATSKEGTEAHLQDAIVCSLDRFCNGLAAANDTSALRDVWKSLTLAELSTERSVCADISCRRILRGMLKCVFVHEPNADDLYDGDRLDASLERELRTSVEQDELSKLRWCVTVWTAACVSVFARLKNYTTPLPPPLLHDAGNTQHIARCERP
ncbi:hypothetical protein CYMTET_4346 [Cymbomonas tetramitiformis]|uniref:Uncharacterized protein n=1 Tax=Cymbomonas tetramitiformis TaxID=36881 RepID=A0AAE0EXU9_9CHLO|nr:hypothetical protein CYMTET_47279 [Cymbomonas tetramitiformis]KAK3288164.1 hypothetical protein CYMTET_4346 [Cymbomonas tetramitiformis]